MGKLTAAKLKSLTEPGRYSDGDGMFLVVKPAANSAQRCCANSVVRAITRFPRNYPSLRAKSRVSRKNEAFAQQTCAKDPQVARSCTGWALSRPLREWENMGRFNDR